MNNLITDEQWGIEFFRFSDLQSLNVDRYFSCLNLMKSLFEGPDFKIPTTGFYLNHISNRHPDDDGGISVRLTYFTNNSEKTKEAIKNFINNRDIKIYPSKDRTDPHSAPISAFGEEPRFRNFLNTYTQIGLDLLNNNTLLQFRILISEYMSRLFPRRISGQSLFEHFFNSHSNFFKIKLDKLRREQLWKDLSYFPSRSECYPHFLANMFVVSDQGIIGQ